MSRVFGIIGAFGVLLTVGTAAAAGPAPPQGYQSDAAFAASYAANGVVNVSATTERVSCYAPEVPYSTSLTASDGYPGGGETTCPGATTGEQTSGFPTQDVSSSALLVKDPVRVRHSRRPGQSVASDRAEQVVRQR